MVGVPNGCTVTRRDPETIRLQLAGIVLSTLVMFLELVQLKESLRVLFNLFFFFLFGHTVHGI